MKKFLRIAVAIYLVVILLLEVGSCAYSILGPQDEDEVSMVGEIYSVSDAWWDVAEDGNYDPRNCYYIKVRPVGWGNNQELLNFTVNCDTEMESEFGPDLSRIPELKVGAIVEITHTYKMFGYGDWHPDDLRNYYVYGYEAFSIRLYEGEYKGYQVVLQKNRAFSPLSIAPSWITSYNVASDNVVSYVAKVNYPLRGYIVYIEGDRFPYWLGEGLIIDPATKRALDSGAVGYSVKIADGHNHPFNNLKAIQCEYIQISHYADFAQHKKYHEYEISEFVNTKKILVTSKAYHGLEMYYYIKLDSGEAIVSYSENEKKGYNDLCYVNSSGDSVRGTFPTEGFNGETYVLLESIGDVPASGTLIISFVPIEKLGDKILNSD